MELQTVRIPYKSKSWKWKFTPLGDIHIGAAGCDEKSFKKKVREIAEDENHWTIFMGDHCECVTQKDPRWDEKAVADWMFEKEVRGKIVQAQMERFLELVEPIPKERILGVHEGNHESKVRSHHQQDLTMDIAEAKGVTYLGQEAFTRVVFERANSRESHQLDIFSTHGSGGGRKTGAKVNKIEDLGGFIEARVYLMGHVHDKIVTSKPMLHMNREMQLKARNRIFAITGTFLKTYHTGNSYGAQALYPPTAIGAITLEFSPTTGEFKGIV